MQLLWDPLSGPPVVAPHLDTSFYWEGSPTGTFLVVRDQSIPGVDQSIPGAAGSTASQGQRENLCVGNTLLPKPTMWVCSLVPGWGGSELERAAGSGSYEWDDTGGICLWDLFPALVIHREEKTSPGSCERWRMPR